jgi:hypothetical protein
VTRKESDCKERRGEERRENNCEQEKRVICKERKENNCEQGKRIIVNKVERVIISKREVVCYVPYIA